MHITVLSPVAAPVRFAARHEFTFSDGSEFTPQKRNALKQALQAATPVVHVTDPDSVALQELTRCDIADFGYSADDVRETVTTTVKGKRKRKPSGNTGNTAEEFFLTRQTTGQHGNVPYGAYSEKEYGAYQKKHDQTPWTSDDVAVAKAVGCLKQQDPDSFEGLQHTMAVYVEGDDTPKEAVFDPDAFLKLAKQEIIRVHPLK